MVLSHPEMEVKRDRLGRFVKGVKPWNFGSSVENPIPSLDWVAGFFDGEGGCYIGVTKRKNGSIRVSPYISISQKSRFILEKLKKKVGVGRIEKASSGFTSKTVWQYRVTGRDNMRKFILKIMNKVVLKRKQLYLMNEFLKLHHWKKVRSYRRRRYRLWTPETLLEALKLAKEINSMNPKCRKQTIEKIDRFIKEIEREVKSGKEVPS